MDEEKVKVTFDCCGHTLEIEKKFFVSSFGISFEDWVKAGCYVLSRDVCIECHNEWWRAFDAEMRGE